MLWTKNTLGKVFDDICLKYPDNEFLVWKDKRLSYSEVEVESTKLAKAFLAMGIGKGDRIAIWISNRPEFVITWLAAARIGAILVAMNTRYKVAEATYVLRQSGAKLLIFTDDFVGIDFVQMVSEILSGLYSEPKVQSPMQVICISNEIYNGMKRYREVLDMGSKIADEEYSARLKEVQPDDPTLIIYTSGTTGSPKGATHSHDAILKNEHRITKWQGVTYKDRRLSYMPPYHIAGSCTEVIGTMMIGACLVMMEAFDPRTALSLIESERCTIVDGIPTHFIMMTELPDFKKYDLSSLRGGWVGGASVTVEVIRAIREKMGMKQMVVVYGMTETISVTSFTRPEESVELITSTDGIPISVDDPAVFGTPPGFEVGIFEPDTDRRLGIDVEGEIRVKGDIVMLGYFNLEEETQKSFTDGWFCTGDLGRIFQNGYLKVTGRIKDMFIVGGTNVYPAEIEAYISTDPKVKMVQVVGVPDHRLGEVCMAFVEPKINASLDAEEIISFCKGNIANYKVPKFVRIMEETEWPLTPTGKVQKFRLRELAVKELNIS